MIVEIIPCLNDNYSYLILEKKSNTVSIVDPSEFAPCEKIIKNYKKLDNILITHHHADHVGGNLKLKEKVLKINNNLKINSPTIPSVLDEELECNIFKS